MTDTNKPKLNTFAEMNNDNNNDHSVPDSGAILPSSGKPDVTDLASFSSSPESSQSSSSGEINIDDFSNTAVGDKKKYIRPNLDKEKDRVIKFQVFQPDRTVDEKQPFKNGSGHYWKATCILTYNSLNSDGVNNREYISGVKCFEQRNGCLSEPTFWYDGCETQVGYLWELVAKTKGIDPKDLTPRQFMIFMNNEPECIIESISYKNYNSKDPGAPKKINKNMPGKFIV